MTWNVIKNIQCIILSRRKSPTGGIPARSNAQHSYSFRQILEVTIVKKLNNFKVGALLKNSWKEQKPNTFLLCFLSKTHFRKHYPSDPFQKL